MTEIPSMAGDYAGSGEWYDSAGKSGTYHVLQTIGVLPHGLELSFRHDFDDGSVTEARLTLSEVAPHIFRVAMMESPVGHASSLDGVLHYHLEVGGKFVEVGYRPRGSDLMVSGSSTRNAEGNYIAWTERLRRAVGLSSP